MDRARPGPISTPLWEAAPPLLLPPQRVEQLGGVVGQDRIDPRPRLFGPLPRPGEATKAADSRLPALPSVPHLSSRDTAPRSQLTDALQLLLAREPIHGVVLSGTRHDIGNPVDWLKTNILFASRDAATWEALRPMLRELLGPR